LRDCNGAVNWQQLLMALRIDVIDRLLVLVRHGESEWNLGERFAGWSDIGLTETGRQQARAAGILMKAQGLGFDIGFSSALQRARHTLDLMLGAMGQDGIPVVADARLNERSYGELTGRTMSDAVASFGAEQVKLWRRSYDMAPPGGESLKDVSARVLPFYIQEVLPRVLSGERVLVAAHNNSLRALIMVLERLDAQQILERSLDNGAPLLYRLNADSTVAETRDLTA
jgi:2,3-bisphosphoglycerate-dependent phosphoglycerate mutase